MTIKPLTPTLDVKLVAEASDLCSIMLSCGIAVLLAHCLCTDLLLELSNSRYKRCCCAESQSDSLGRASCFGEPCISAFVKVPDLSAAHAVNSHAV
jgi:hypothetical protein